MMWISFTYLFTFRIYIAVKHSSSPQRLISIHCLQCKLLRPFVLILFLQQSYSNTWGSLLDGNSGDLAAQVWDSLP